MTIHDDNIVFLAHQVMDDVPEGGGAATGNVIADGAINNVFADISDLARAYGKFSLRKLSLAVRELGTSLYGGAKSIISAIPVDPALSYTLFTTNDPFDTRTEALSRVESYLYKGPTWPGALNENHLAGMRSISVIQRVGSALPVVGKTLCLVQNEDLSNQIEQYVRVIKISYTETTFTDASGDFTRWIVRLDLSDSLRHAFSGHTVNRTDTYNYTGKTRLRDTTVADAAQYYGSQPLAEAADIGDRTIKANSVYTQLVPSTQTETPIVDAQPPGAIVTVSAGARSVDILQIAETRSIPVTAENRSLNYVFSCLPLPAVRTVTVSYRALGNWYVIRDELGDGTLTGDSAGAGTISFVTGSGVASLAALPDVGSAILIAWGTPIHYQSIAGLQADIKPPHIAYTVQHPPIKPTTLTVQYVSGGVTRTATEAAAGIFAGQGSGPVDYTAGRLYLTPSLMPDANSDAIVAYTEEARTTGSLIVAPTVRTFVLTLPTAGDTVQPGSLTLGFAVVASGPLGKVYHETMTVTDNGSGGLVGEIVQTGSSIDYAGTVTLVLAETLDREGYEISWFTAYWGIYPFSVPVETTTFYYSFSKSLAAETAHSETVPLSAMTIDLSPLTTDSLIPNSLQWQWLGRTYQDINGIIYDVATGIAVGTANYATKTLTLTAWPQTTGAFTLTSGLVTRGPNTVIQAAFRTPGSPIRPQSLQVTATTQNGETITALANASSVIVGDEMDGTVELEYGVIEVRFGAEVLDSSLTTDEKAEDWYNAADIVGGYIFKPIPVLPSSIRFNCVLYSYLPLDASILGIDAVRLPSDGRVPIFRTGSLVEIIHAVTNSPATPVLNVGTDQYELSAGRTRLAWTRVTDAAGDPVNAYTLDRATGVLSWESLSGLVTPVTVEHVIGDLRLVTDVQIDGTLTLSRALSHPFPADDALVCACLIHGDRRARVSAIWDQASWVDSAWEDAINGGPATATLNTIDFPPTVTNEGCDTDRWLLRWTTTTAVELISEKRGRVWTGDFPAYVSGDPVDIAPINPRTRTLVDGVYTGGVPYMTIPQRANGGGWSIGNIVRINTVGANADFWVAQSVGQSEEPSGDGLDGCTIYALGNIDRP